MALPYSWFVYLIIEQAFRVHRSRVLFLPILLESEPYLTKPLYSRRYAPMARLVKAHKSTCQMGVNPEPGSAQFGIPENPAEKVPPQAAGLVRCRQNGMNITKVSLGLKAIFFMQGIFVVTPSTLSYFCAGGQRGLKSEFGMWPPAHRGLRPGGKAEI